MKILLDTHILLWALTGAVKLPEKAKELILSEKNEIYYSTATIWEVTIKHMLHPEHMTFSGKQLSVHCQNAGYQMLAISDDHAHMLETLERIEGAPKHKDPFDRIMLAQAKAEEMLFVTHDLQMPYYRESCVIKV